MTLSVAIVLVIAIGTVVIVTSGGDEDPSEEDLAIGTDTTQEAVSATEPSTTTTTTEPPGPDLPGEEFTDPEGVYTMHIDPAWHSEHGTMMQGVELWAIEPTSGDLPAIVNIATALQGDDLSVVIDDAARGLESADGFTLIDKNVLDGALGQELGFVEYTGTQEGQPVHVLQFYLVGESASVVATLITPPETFSDTRAAIEPHLLTLQFVDCPTTQFSCVEDP